MLYWNSLVFVFLLVNISNILIYSRNFWAKIIWFSGINIRDICTNETNTKSIYIRSSCIKVACCTKGTYISNTYDISACSVNTCIGYIDIKDTYIETSYVKGRNLIFWDSYIYSSAHKSSKFSV